MDTNSLENFLIKILEELKIPNWYRYNEEDQKTCLVIYSGLPAKTLFSIAIKAHISNPDLAKSLSKLPMHIDSTVIWFPSFEWKSKKSLNTIAQELLSYTALWISNTKIIGDISQSELACLAKAYLNLTTKTNS